MIENITFCTMQDLASALDIFTVFVECFMRLICNCGSVPFRRGFVCTVATYLYFRLSLSFVVIRCFKDVFQIIPPGRFRSRNSEPSSQLDDGRHS